MTEKSLAGKIVGASTLAEFRRFLGTRPDLLSPDSGASSYRDDMLEPEPLRRPFPRAAVQSILAEQFGRPESVFEDIDLTPCYQTPLTQTHRALARDGRKVLLRILPPALLHVIRRKRRRIDLLVRIAGSGMFSSTREVIDEWTAWQAAEFNPARELAHVSSLALALPLDSALQIPRPYPELSGPRVLAIEDLGGIPLRDVLSPARRSELPLGTFGFDPRTLAVNLLATNVREIFVRRYYNSLVDPRNMLLLPGNRFTFLNFAHCEAIDAAAALNHVRFLAGIFDSELPASYQTLEQLLDPTEHADAGAMRTDFIQESLQWLRGESTLSVRRGDRTYGSPMSAWMLALMRAARRNRFQIHGEMLAAWRALIGIEWIANRLDAGVHLQSVGMEVLADIRLDEAMRILEPQVQYNALSDLLTTLSSAPENLRRILSDSVSGALAMNLNVARQTESAAMRDRRSKIIAAATAAVGIAWLMGESEIPRIAWLPPAALLGLVYLYILVQWRRLRP